MVHTTPSPAAPRRGPALPLACFYAALFGAFGAYLPFWPLWLEQRGLDGSGIGAVLGIGFVVRIVGIPLVGAMVDRAGEYRRPLVLLSALAVASFGAYAAARGPAQLLLASLLVSVTLLPVPPLTEGLAVSLAREGRFDYGSVRLWGSVAFIAANVVAGRLVATRGPSVVLPWVMGFMLLTVLVGTRLPRITVAPSQRHWIRAVPEVLRLPGLTPFLAASGLLHASHALYYTSSAVDWRAQGLDATMVGLLWGLGVLVEVVLLARSGALGRVMEPHTLAVIGGLGGTLRWTLLAFAPAWPLLLVGQLLHALSFAAAHVATMEHIRRHVPPGLTATAQGVYSALAGGLLLGGATLAGGWAYDRWSSRAYLLMTVLCLAGSGWLAWHRRRAMG